MKKALITGITGQDGSYLAEFLLEKGYEVHGITRRASISNTARIDHLIAKHAITLHDGDLSDSSSLIRIIGQVQPDEIYNLAAQSHVQVSFDVPEYSGEVDAIGVLRILEAVRILGLTKKTKIYQASTSELYGKVEEIPQKETTPFHPYSPYAVAKQYGFWITKEYREAYGMFAVNGILFNHESERRGENFVTRKITLAAGRIAEGLKQAGVKNPLMLLDEIDKVSSDYKGDTSAALLEVLDSGQNSRFRDHYIELPMDLSQVLFIATANTTSTIPAPLLDRMELIEVNSYTANEKFHIAKEHLVKKQWEKNGLTGKQLSLSDNALKGIIEGYTREAGVRDLERKLGEICRKAAREILKDPARTVKVTGQNLEKYLGHVKFTSQKKNTEDEIGIVRGLAWTSVGGETLEIEVNRMPGKGDIELTGQMGDVMKESALTALSFVRSVGEEYHIPDSMFQKYDFHIHIPEGAVPKDGPSAGITMATALLSAATDIPVWANLAMTGEITLRGRVLPIGGLKEKLLAAKTAGVTKVLVPEENLPDVEEISTEIKKGLEIVPVKSMEQVLSHALTKKPQAGGRKSAGRKKTGGKEV